MRPDAFEGRRVAVLGYGSEGRSACRWLSENAVPAGLDVYTGDQPPPEAGHGRARFLEGLPDADRLARYDIVIRSPGISPYRPPLSGLPADGPEVITGAEIWFAAHPEARTVVVTGTKGKSTTAALLAHLLEQSGLGVGLGGNIGVPLTDLMDVNPEPDIWVFELSSYQIQGLKARPSIAVILNLFPEHLDWHGSKDRYFRDKLSLLEGLRPGIAVLNHADPELRERVPPRTEVRWYNEGRGIHCSGDAIYRGREQLFELDRFPLAGAHNRSNLCAALAVMELVGLDPAIAKDGLGGFQPLPHRLHSLGIRDGLEYVDDSISTTPNAAIAALECYPERAVTALVGGYDRGLDWRGFCRFASGRKRLRVVTFGALGPRIAASVRTLAPSVHVVESTTLERAVEEARRMTPEGGIVLLSPGAPSFDAFRDYRERGEAFARYAGFDTPAG